MDPQEQELRCGWSTAIDATSGSTDSAHGGRAEAAGDTEGGHVGIPEGSAVGVDVSTPGGVDHAIDDEKKSDIAGKKRKISHADGEDKNDADSVHSESSWSTAESLADDDSLDEFIADGAAELAAGDKKKNRDYRTITRALFEDG